ncbi:hypothetical protein [Actinoallomurus sp. CA-150999]
MGSLQEELARRQAESRRRIAELREELAEVQSVWRLRKIGCPGW